MTDLFNLPETLSPRLAWMKRNNIKVCARCSSADKRPWLAHRGDDYEFGQTEFEAITNLAKLLNIPLWNEEGFGK